MNPDFSLSLHATQQQEIRTLDCKATVGRAACPHVLDCMAPAGGWGAVDLGWSTHLPANCSAEGLIALHCTSDHEPRATKLQARSPMDWTSSRTAPMPQQNCSDVPK